MPLSTPLDEIVIFVPSSSSNGHARAHGLSSPMMLAEAVRRALECIEAGGRPSIVVRGTTYSDPGLFRDIFERPDYPE